MFDVLLKALEWLVEEKLIGVPVAAFVALGVVGVAAAFYALRRPTPTVAADGGAKVQQTTVQRVRAEGDVNVTPRQE